MYNLQQIIDYWQKIKKYDFEHRIQSTYFEKEKNIVKMLHSQQYQNQYNLCLINITNNFVTVMLHLIDTISFITYLAIQMQHITLSS